MLACRLLSNEPCRRDRAGQISMPDRFQSTAYLILCGLLAAAMAGCACSCPHCAPTSCLGWQANCGPANPCYGFFPTCWRDWPSDCPPCPSFAMPTGTGAESIPTPDLPPVLPSPNPEINQPATESSGPPANAQPDRSLPFPPPQREQPDQGARFPRRDHRATELPVFIPARLDSR